MATEPETLRPTIEFLTLRSADSISSRAYLLMRVTALRAAEGGPGEAGRLLRREVEAAIEAAPGARPFLDAAAAGRVEDRLLAAHGRAYELLAWSIGAAYVRAAFRLLGRTHLRGVVRAWKRGSTADHNRALATTGAVFARDVLHRALDPGDETTRAIAFIEGRACASMRMFASSVRFRDDAGGLDEKAMSAAVAAARDRVKNREGRAAKRRSVVVVRSGLRLL